MKRGLRWLTVFIFFVVMATSLSCGKDQGDEVRTLKFGIGVPLTGIGGAIAGVPIKRAMEMAEDNAREFKIGDERYIWDFIVEDDQCSIAGGVASANKLIFDHHVNFLEYNCADSGLAAAMIAEEMGIITLVGNCSLFDAGPELAHTFMHIAICELDTAALFDFVAKEHPEVKRVSIAYSDIRSGLALRDAAQACCNYYGLECAGEEIPFLTVEYYPIASRIMTHQPDLVIGTLPLFQAMWDMGYDGLCANYFWSEEAFGEVDWDKAEGMLIYSVHPIEVTWPELEAFTAEYQARYSSKATAVSLLGILLPDLMTQVLVKAGTVDDTDKIIEAMETYTFDTSLGTVYFGGEQLIGVRRVLMLPQPILEVVGSGEYRVVHSYSPDEVEAVLNTIYRGR